MSNIGKRVLIKGYSDSRKSWNGMQGVITGENSIYYNVRLDNGEICAPFKPEYYTPQCEIIEEIPKKWKVAITEQNRDTLEEYWRKLPNVDTSPGFVGWLLSASYDNTYQHWGDGDGYTEITFEQFQTHILKQNNMKKLIGYKLKDNLWIGDRKDRVLDGIAKVGLIFTSSTEENINQVMFRMAHPAVIENYKAAGVLDVWFTPIYEDDKVEIGSYEAKKEGHNIVVGCQTYTKDTLLVIQSLLKRETKHEVKVDGINITLEHINKLLALLNT